MNKPKDAHLTQQLAREVCQRTGSKATIEGFISGLSNQYELKLQAVECLSNKALMEVDAKADGKQQVLKVLGEEATRIRKKLGESLASVQKYDVRVENVTTSSLQALQAYSQGYQAWDIRADYKLAMPLFERAVSLDPNFAMAYAHMGYAGQLDPLHAAEDARKAYELRQRVSERERFYIEAGYEYNLKENLEATRKVYEQWAQLYPRDEVPPNDLGIIYGYWGDYEKQLSFTQLGLK